MADVEVSIKGGAKEAKEAKRPQMPEAKPEKAVGPEVRKMVRIIATDVIGTLPTKDALRKIRGVGFMLSNAICTSTGIDGKKMIGALNENELKTLQSFIRDQAKSPTIPKWMVNRRKSPDTGADAHIVGDSLTFQQREDIHFMKRIRCRRGIRHELGLPVRGQHTKSTGRHGRGVGVIRKVAAAAAAPAATPKAAAPATAAKAASAAKPAEAKK
jgi:small subunit ribosomal protein S13